MSPEKNKSIALVANSCWYIYNLRLGVITALQKANYTITVIAPHDDFTEKLVHENCLVITVNLNCKGMNPIEDISYCFKLMQLYRRHKFSHIFHFTIKPNIYGSIAAAFLNIDSTTIISGLGYPFTRKGLFYYFIQLLYFMANSAADEIWFVNQDDKNLFEKKRIVNANKTQLLPGEGINIQHFTRVRPYGNHDNTPIHFLFSGRLIWSKGVGEFVKAARIIKNKYPETVFSILGYLHVNNRDAISADTIASWQQEGVINYLGSTNDVRPYLESASCLILPSYYGEGVPRSLLEAACMEVPIIATDHVGCREVVKCGFNGFLCQKRDVMDLVKKIEDFLSIEAVSRRRLGENGRKFMIDKFDESFVVSYYLKKLNCLQDKQLAISIIK